MKTFKLKYLLIIVFLSNTISSQNNLLDYKRINCGNISTSFSANGLSDYLEIEEESQFRYPKDSLNGGGFYYTGVLWGGKIDGQVRVSGTTFFSSLQPSNNKRIYRVRRDYQSNELTSEINDGEGTISEIRIEYEKDWNEWPGNDGAPYDDVNNNNLYEPNIDIPGIPGATQTVWLEANDYDSMLVDSIFGSQPLKIKLQATYWSYNLEPPLGNIIFRKYLLINTDNKSIEDMYIMITTDPDIGNPGDDYVGCDTLLNLAFAYSSRDSDSYFGTNIPAVGYSLVKGPMVKNEEIRLSSFNFIFNNDAIYGYPETGSYINGTLKFYNLFQGKLKDGNKYKVPDEFGGGHTAFPFSGNPITSEGWLDGTIRPPGNRNMNLSTGPFNLLPSGKQEVVFAQITAGRYNSIRRLEAIDSLKKYTAFIKEFYKTQIDTVTNVTNKQNLPIAIKLNQNYPNPFNPSTKIKYSIPSTAFVTLKIYNAVGSEVQVLVNKKHVRGNYQVNFDGSNVSSGVYFYKINTNHFQKVRKMVLVK